MSTISLKDKLIGLDFAQGIAHQFKELTPPKEKGSNFYSIYLKKLPTNRFDYLVFFNKTKNMFTFCTTKMRGVRIINESSILNNHNNLCSGAKEHWLKIKEQIAGYEYFLEGIE